MNKTLFQKAFLLLLAILCLFLINGLLAPCLGVMEGRVVVRRVSLSMGAEDVLLNGKSADGVTFFTIPEQVFFRGEIGNPMRAGVTVMVFVRILPLVFCGVCFFLFFIRAVRDEIFSERNAKLFLLCGVIFLATTLLAPIINGHLIPALVNATSTQYLEVGVNIQGEPRLYKGLVLLFFAFVLQKGVDGQKSQ